jgi:hypothetical protein
MIYYTVSQDVLLGLAPGSKKKKGYLSPSIGMCSDVCANDDTR